MVITLKRQLTPEEKATILQRHGRVCFATGHAIPDQDSLHFDHVRAFALGGRSELDNIAPMCEAHNKAKGMLPLEDFRISLHPQEFFKTDDRLTLKNLLQFLKARGQVSSFGAHSALTQADGKVKLDSTHGSFTNDLLSCPTTGWKYFYATLPVALIDSDDDEDTSSACSRASLSSTRFLDCSDISRTTLSYSRPLGVSRTGRFYFSMANIKLPLFSGWEGGHSSVRSTSIQTSVCSTKPTSPPTTRLLRLGSLPLSWC